MLLLSIEVSDTLGNKADDDSCKFQRLAEIMPLADGDFAPILPYGREGVRQGGIYARSHDDAADELLWKDCSPMIFLILCSSFCSKPLG